VEALTMAKCEPCQGTGDSQIALKPEDRTPGAERLDHLECDGTGQVPLK
jgi:hypothetical protein